MGEGEKAHKKKDERAHEGNRIDAFSLDPLHEIEAPPLFFEIGSREGETLPFHGFLVEFEIGLCRPLPGKIGCHGVLNYFSPVAGLGVETNGNPDPFKKFLGIIALNLKPFPFPVAGS